MKKPEFKKTYTRGKESGSRESKSFAPKFGNVVSKPTQGNAVRFEKPIYKGKEDRLAGTRTRNETRMYSGYAPRTKKPELSFTSKSIESKKFSTKNEERKTTPSTSWGGVADWYNNHLEKSDDTYHTKVIFPNILRMLGDVSGKKILDMACGQGIFAEKLRDLGALVTGVDLGKELIAIAEEKSKSIKEKGTHKVVYHVASADDLFMIKDASVDIVVCILALQNIDDLQKTIGEARRVLTKTGKLLFVLNHPSFRNPKQTHWGYYEAENTQYRRVDEYMSESHVRIDMTPGSQVDKKFTVSFHRPLQVYVKALSKNGFAVTRLEEWVSHRESERGPKKKAEDKARKEIPLFMCVEAIII
jgi:ubiquinone/menaquinone biosynthesis C-methylase UbiE